MPANKCETGVFAVEVPGEPRLRGETYLDRQGRSCCKIRTTISMSHGVVEFGVAADRAELNRKHDEALPPGNSACGGEPSAADFGGRKDAEARLMDCFLGGTTDINRKAICDREIAARNLTASNSATIQVSNFTEKPCGDRGGFEDGAKDNDGFPGCDSFLVPRSKDARDGNDDDFRLGNIHATARSDLLITHGVSDEDTLYLIKREETREAEDFWLKIDRARNKTQSSSPTMWRDDSKADTGRAEEGLQKEMRRLGDQNNTQTSIYLSPGQSQATSWQHDKTTEPSAPSGRQSADVHDRTEDDNNSLEINKQSLNDSRKAINTSGSPAACCFDETNSLPVRTLQLLRGVRGNGSQGYDVRTGKNEKKKRSHRGEERWPDAGKDIDSRGKVDATLFDALDKGSDGQDQSEVSSSSSSTPTENEVQSRLGGHQAGTEKEKLNSVHSSPLAPEIPSEEFSGNSAARPHCVRLPPTTKTKTASDQIGRPPALDALTSRDTLQEVQADSTEVGKHSVQATGEWKAVQVPQVVITAAETDEAPVKLWNIIKRTLQRQGNAHTLETSPSSLAAAQSQTKSPIAPNHEHKDKNEGEDQEGAILLVEEVQRKQEETSPQKEPKQRRVQLDKGVDQRLAQLHGQFQLSSTRQEAFLSELEQTRRTCFSSTDPLSVQHHQEREKQQQWADSEKAGVLTDFVADTSEEGTAATKRDTDEKKECTNDDPAGREGTLEECADARPLTVRLVQLSSTSRHNIRKEEQEKNREKHDVREAENRKEQCESFCPEQWSAAPQVTVMRGDDKKTYPLNLPPGRRVTQASEYTQVDLSTIKRTDEQQEMKEFPPCESSSSARRFPEESASVQGLTSARIARDITVEVPQTLTEGFSPTSVRMSRMPIQTSADEERRLIRGGKELRGASHSQAEENFDAISHLSKKAWQEEFTRLNAAGGSCEVEGCTVQNVLQKQQAEESWFLSEDREHARRVKNEQSGIRSPSTWSTADIRAGDTRKHDKTPFLLRRRSDTSTSHRRKSRSQNRELEVMLQRLLGKRFELHGSRRNKGDAEILTREETRLRDQLEEIKETKAVNMNQRISACRSSRLQRLSSSTAQPKVDSDMRRMLRVVMRGGGHRADELADRWLHHSSSDESSYRKKRSCRHGVGKTLTTACRGNRAVQQRARQTCTEEERNSQSSSETSRGWVNLENDEHQDEDEDQCLLEKESLPPPDMRERVFSECSAKSDSSGNAGGLETAASYSPAAALLAVAPVTGVRRDSNGSGQEHDSSSRRNDKKSNSVQRSGSSTSSNSRARRYEAALEQRDDKFEQVKKTNSAGTSMCSWFDDDCALSSDHHAGSSRQRTRDHQNTTAAIGGYEECMRIPTPQDSPSSVSVCSSRVGWETLDTELAFPMMQRPEHEIQAVRASEGEPPRDAEAHAFPFFWQRALRTHDVVHKGAGAGRRSAAEAPREEGKEEENQGAGQWKFAALKKGNRKEAEAGKTHQEEASSSDHSNRFFTREKVDAGTEGRHAAVICSESHMPHPTGISLLRLFGTAVGGWSFLHMGWKKHEDRETKDDTVGEDVHGEENKESSLYSGRRTAVSAKKTHSSETIGKPSLLRGTSSRDKRILKLCGKRSLATCRRQRKRSSSHRRIRVRRGVISKDGPGGGGKHEVGRSGGRIDRGRNTGRGRHGLCSNSNTAASSASIGWEGTRNGNRYYRSGSNSMVDSTSGSVYRRKKHQIATGNSCASSSEAEKHTLTGALNGSNVNLYATLSQRPTLSTADTPGKRCLEADVRICKGFLQPRIASLHSLSTPVHPYRTRCPTVGRAGSKHPHHGAATSRRPMKKVSVNTPLKKSFCDWHRRGGRVLLEHLEKELGYREFPTRRAGRRHVAKQAATHVLRLRNQDNSGTTGARRVPLNESRRSRCSREASLGSTSNVQVKDSTSARIDSSRKSSNGTHEDMYGRPPCTLFRTPAVLREGLTFQSSSRRLVAFPGVSPLSAAAHLYGAGTFCQADGAALLSNAAPFTAVATPLFATGAQTDNFKSPVYVGEAATGCPPRLTASAVGAALPTEEARVARTQSACTLAGTASDTALLFRRNVRGSSSTADGHTDTGTCATAANTLPYWYRWPAAVLRVVGLPLRCVVQVLGLNVSGAFDRWREEIRQRSLRGFLTLCFLDGVVCAAAVWGVCHLAVFASRAAFRAAYLHVHSIDAERASHYFDGVTYRFWGKRPLYFTDNPFLGAGRAADAEIATDPWSGLHHLQHRGIAWYQHHMYGDL